MSKRLESDSEKYMRHSTAIAEASERRHGIYNSIADKAEDASAAVEDSGGIAPMYIDDADFETRAYGTRYDKSGAAVWQSRADEEEGARGAARREAREAAARPPSAAPAAATPPPVIVPPPPTAS